MAEKSESGPKLSDIFSELWKSYEFLESTNESSSSDVLQTRVKTAIEETEKAILMVNMLDLFSENEDFEEIATSEIKYMLLPALLGYFCGKELKRERLDVIKKSQTCYIDFLKLLKYYGVTDAKIPDIQDKDEGDKTETAPIINSRPDIRALEASRQQKIDRFKKQKEMDKKLKELWPNVEAGKADDETERDYYRTLLNKWIYSSIEEVESIQNEIPLLEHMKNMQLGANKNPPQAKKEDKSKGVVRPFILTKDKLQAQVIGAGYPSLPTYTVDDFYEWRFKEEIEQMKAAGHLHGQTPQSIFGMPEGDPREKEEADAEERDAKEDAYDEEETARKRAIDDWKDSHRRGWGNRYNRH